jgi:hypothetical protein
MKYSQERSKNTKMQLDPGLYNTIAAGCQWLTPVILGTQEAEIRRIEVQSQSQT